MNSKFQELSYHDACLARGLLEDDQHLSLAMDEDIIVSCQSQKFAGNHYHVLWACKSIQLSEDFLLQHYRNISKPQAGYTVDQIYNLDTLLQERTDSINGSGSRE